MNTLWTGGNKGQLMRGGNSASPQVKSGQAQYAQDRVYNLYRQSGGTFTPRTPIDVLRPAGAGLVPTDKYKAARAVDDYNRANPTPENPPVLEQNLRAFDKAQAEQARQEQLQRLRDQDEEDELGFKKETRAFGRDMLSRQRKALAGGNSVSTGGNYGVSGL